MKCKIWMIFTKTGRLYAAHEPRAAAMDEEREREWWEARGYTLLVVEVELPAVGVPA